MGGAAFLAVTFAALVVLASPVVHISLGGFTAARSGDLDRAFYNTELSNGSAQPVNYSRIVASIAVGSNPGQIAIDPATGLLYTANTNSLNVSVVDTSSDRVIASIATNYPPVGAALDESNAVLYVSEDNYVSSPNTTVGINVATNQIVQTAPVGSTPGWVEWDAADGLVYVADLSGNTVDALNASTGTLENTIQVGRTPTSIAFDSANDLLYVADHGSHNISVIDPSNESVVANISLQGNPYEVIADPANNEVFVTLQGANVVDAIDTTTQLLDSTYQLTGTEFPPSPTGMAFDPTNGVLYVTEELTNEVVGLNLSTGQIVSSVTLPQYPYDIAYDPSDGFLYVDTYYRGYPDINTVVVLGPSSAANNSAIPSTPSNTILGLSPSAAYVGLGFAIGLAAGSAVTFVVTKRGRNRPPSRA